jgi:hypothetical protein
MNRFREEPIRRERPQVDEMEIYKRLRDMELEEDERESRHDNGDGPESGDRTR